MGGGFWCCCRETVDCVHCLNGKGPVAFAVDFDGIIKRPAGVNCPADMADYLNDTSFILQANPDIACQWLHTIDHDETDPELGELYVRYLWQGNSICENPTLFAITLSAGFDSFTQKYGFNIQMQISRIANDVDPSTRSSTYQWKTVDGPSEKLRCLETTALPGLVFSLQINEMAYDISNSTAALTPLF